MSPRQRNLRSIVVLALATGFATGIAAGWKLHDVPNPISRVVDGPQPEIAVVEPEPTRPPAGTVGTDGSTEVTRPTDSREAAISGLIISADVISELRRRSLRLPIDNAKVDAMKGQFGESRAGGARGHEAVDLLAPRNTPVYAVEDGTIAKLFESKAGGTTIYQFDKSGRFCYYYAHLERYASGLHDQQTVSAGQTIGYVGTTGNAPKNTPHLHFAIFELTPEKRWWKGKPIDPYLVFKK